MPGAAPAELTFPLVPRRRLGGLGFGALRSARRGIGGDVAGSRPYRRGDDVDTIDWSASARLSSARGSDEFIVREHHADEAPRVVLVCDRRPAMRLFPDSLPWLAKAEAQRVAAELICASAVAALGVAGSIDFADGGEEPEWVRPRGAGELWRIEERLEAPFRAPEATLELAFEHLARFRRSLPAGTFVFVLSDFLAPPPASTWLDALAHGLDVVPVVIQDAVWERSFPPVGSLVVPVAEPASGRVCGVRLTRAEAAARRRAHEARWEDLMEELGALGLDPVVLATSDPAEICSAFEAWAGEREAARGRPW